MVALQELLTAVRAPAMALSQPDGQIRSGADGVYLNDRRLLSRLVVTVDGQLPLPVRAQSVGADEVRVVAVTPWLGDRGTDPTVYVDRRRLVSATGLRETVIVSSRAREPVSCRVGLELASDLADLADVRQDFPSRPLEATYTAESGRWGDRPVAHASFAPPADTVDAAQWRWQIELAPGGSWQVTVDVQLSDDPEPAVITPPQRAMWGDVEVVAGDYRLTAFVRQSLADLDGLLAADPAASEDQFLTAGSPWYLTLFGRDSLWAARLMLPLSTDLAHGTLRTLARRQGRQVDIETAEAPGKIMHELRRAATEHGTTSHAARAMTLPPLYYGTVDATQLWILLLHDAWRWGLADAHVMELLPALEAALGWLRDYAIDDSGFVRYVDESGHGLANQGWKDSADAVQFLDGTLATPPIALCEVQAYAYAAAIAGAELLDAFGRPAGDDWRAWAAALRERFRAGYWVSDDVGRFPAIAVDGNGQPVNTVTSNLGHLLATGLLDDHESEIVVGRLAADDMDCGFGLRTLSDRAAGFNPLSYHCGSVWAHDTAITIAGLARMGTARAQSAAASLIDGLLGAAAAFDYRIPELHGGETAEPGRLPLAYPPACRPQAWSAASSVAIVSTILGIEPDVPAGRVRVRPLRPSPVGDVTVRGLRLGDGTLDLHVAANGDVDVLAGPPGIEVHIG